MKEKKTQDTISLGDNPFHASYPRVAVDVALPDLPQGGAPDYDALFPFVNKPSRYIGGEWNSIHKPADFRKGAVSLCLCFPDLYETGFANMGVEILYRVVNRRPDAYAERCYAVDEDMAKFLRDRRWPLFSLESRTSLKEFDLVGFSLPYELCYNNILEMLDLAGIPVRALHRDRTHPLVIGGGPCSVNPEPLADFFDAVVIGDGEQVLGEMMDKVREWKASGRKSREEILLALASVPGVYVPSLYEVIYKEDGTIHSVTPKHPAAPERVAYRQQVLSDKGGEAFSFPTTPIVPFVQTVHDRLNVEIQRGCPWRCRFCQAGFTYHKYRERTKNELIPIIEEGLRNTGYDAVTLAGLSAADHTEIVPMAQALAETFTPRRIAIGLPSTRADRFTLALAEILQSVRRQSLTFAPEAGTERMRRVIRKELQESEIRETLRVSHEHGWKSIKLYFMYGQPTETYEDLDGICDLAKASRRDNRGLSLTMTLSPFVPKPHTPFQWAAQDRLDTHRQKLAYLKQRLPAQIRAHGLEQIVLEGVLSRGDRRCGALLETAWRMGARFDEWSERFQFSLWQKAMEQTGISPEFFCWRERSEKEIFPWDHIQGGPDRRALWNDWQTALKQAKEPVPSDPHLKPRPTVEAPKLEPIIRAQQLQEKTVQRLRFRVSRRGRVRFLSHLEQIDTLRRALRRAGLPVAYTSGFHPQMKCAFGPAVSVGYESDCEYFDVELSTHWNVEQARAALERQLPQGFALVKAASIPVFFPSLEALINRVSYEVHVPERLIGGKPLDQLNRELQEFLLKPDLALEKIKKGDHGPRIVRIPLAPLVVRTAWLPASSIPESGGRTLALDLHFGPGKNAKPEKIAALLLGLSEEDARTMTVRRRSFHIAQPDGSVTEP